MVLERFWSKKGYVFHSGLALRVGSWQCIGYFVYKELFFFCMSIGRFVALFKCLLKWKPFLDSCSFVLGPFTNFRGLKYGINFSLRREKEYGQA